MQQGEETKVAFQKPAYFGCCDFMMEEVIFLIQNERHQTFSNITSSWEGSFTTTSQLKDAIPWHYTTDSHGRRPVAAPQEKLPMDAKSLLQKIKRQFLVV
jgi:hypothetical protein